MTIIPNARANHHHDGLDGRARDNRVVSGEAVIGANIVTNLTAGSRDVVGASFDSAEMGEGMLRVTLSGTAGKTRHE